jgi:hypothetical protein
MGQGLVLLLLGLGLAASVFSGDDNDDPAADDTGGADDETPPAADPLDPPEGMLARISDMTPEAVSITGWQSSDLQLWQQR